MMERLFHLFTQPVVYKAMELPIVKTPMHVTYMYAASEWLMEDRISLRSDFSLLLLDDDAQLLCVRFPAEKSDMK